MNRQLTLIVSGENSQANQTCRNTSNSRSISKYFSKVKVSDNGHSSSRSLDLSSDSPYKNSLSMIKLKKVDDDDSSDFKTPIPIKKAPKVFPKKLRQRKLTSKKKSNKSKNSIQKITKDNFDNLDVNAEHLQMAIALSKSENDLDNHVEENLEIIGSPVKSGTLEKFGFKSKRLKLPAEFNPLDKLEVIKKRKNSKFRYITPTLHTRTAEERESQITTKVSVILSRTQTRHIQEIFQEKPEIYSDYLKNYLSAENRILKSSSFCYGDLKQCRYCISDLNLSPNKSAYGRLLKKWEDIPGRNQSPLRSFTPKHTVSSEEKPSHSIENLKLNESINDWEKSEKQQSCSSPDLFDSDSESCSPKFDITPKKLELTKIYKSDSGIQHFETFSNDSLVLTEDIFNVENIRSKNASVESTAPKEIGVDTSHDEIKTLTDYRIPISENNTVVPGDCGKSAIDTYHNIELDVLDIRTGTTVYGSPNLNQISPKKYEQDSHLNQNETSSGSLIQVCLENSSRSSLSCTKNLNVTDYITNMLQQCDSLNENGMDNIDDDQIPEKESSLSQSSQESIVISDEELNYSIVRSTEKKSKTFYDLENCGDEFLENVCEEDSLEEIHLNLKMKYAKADRNIETNTKNVENSGQEITVTPIKYRSNKKRKTKGQFENHEITVDDEKTTQDKHEQDENSIQLSSSSQESIVISDDELNYSSIQSNEIKDRDFYDLEDCKKPTSPSINEDNFEDVHFALKCKYTQQIQSTQEDNEVVEVPEEDNTDKICIAPEDVSEEVETFNDSMNELLRRESVIKSLENQQELDVCPSESSRNAKRTSKSNNSNISKDNNKETPETNLIIKTKNITPMPKYDEMDTPKIRAELDKIGVKPLKRQRGIQLLKHIYDCTHPTLNSQEIESIEDEESNRLIKRRKLLLKHTSKSKESIGNIQLNLQEQENVDIIGDLLLENEKSEDLIFERKVSKKVPSCPIPLQIAWYNFLMVNPMLHENILSYEPLHLEVIHCMLKEQSGCKFNIEDLITFLDKKCVIFRTQQSSHRTRLKK